MITMGTRVQIVDKGNFPQTSNYTKLIGKVFTVVSIIGERYYVNCADTDNVYFLQHELVPVDPLYVNIKELL